MKVKKEDIKYVVNWSAKKIRREEIISKKFVKYLNEKEVHKLIKEEDTQLGIISERDIIDWLEKEKNIGLWNDKIQNHICEQIIKDDDDYFVGCEYEDFKGGYFFVASLWKMKQGDNLIILEHYH
ncbi:hypothetical protein [Aquimarina sp. MMG016]|uniref:hypothetical protein n=1 Tax=Aquimarina sp. MMG016 TaxID=2822690 RepID=UPI001B39F97C|nr:hypothetical protein [Aquimarina sp. MMG016]MBQ4821087.1 hypothetical protein [Aquimarina sp. MMG016]